MKFRLPQTWLGRVILAWLGGLVLALPVTALAGGTYFEVAFYCLAAILAAFVISDVIRDRRKKADETED